MPILSNRRWICGFGLPANLDDHGGDGFVNGSAWAWNHDAAFTPLGVEGGPGSLTGTGLAYRRSVASSGSFVEQSVAQGGSAPSASSTCLYQSFKMRIRVLPSAEETFFVVSTVASPSYLLTITPAGLVFGYIKNGASPPTQLWGTGPLNVGQWYTFILETIAVPGGGGGVPPSQLLFTLVSPSFINTGNGFPVASVQFNAASLGEKIIFSGTDNLLELDFAEWICDDLGNPPDPSALLIPLDQRIFQAGVIGTARVETRRPTGAGTYNAWTGNTNALAHGDLPADNAAVLTSNVANAKHSFAFGSLTTMNLLGGVRGLRLAVYVTSGGGALCQILLRVGATDLLFPVTPTGPQWISVVVDTTDQTIFPLGYLDPNSAIEVGFQKANNGGTMSIGAIVFQAENLVPDPIVTVPPADGAIKLAYGSYVGNDVGQKIVVGFVPEWLSILPVIGSTGDGALWCDQDVGATGHANTRTSGLRVETLYLDGFQVAGSDPIVNASGTTYNWVAIRDPRSRNLVRGSFAKTNLGTAGLFTYPVLNFRPLFLWAKILDQRNNVGAAPAYARGPGHTGSFSSPVSGAQVALAITAMTIGNFTVNSLAKSSHPCTSYTAWKIDAFTTTKLWNAISYVGDGSGTRSIAIDLSNRAPLWAMILPHNAAGFIRCPGLTCPQSYLIGTSALSLSSNGIRGGGLNSILVDANLNQAGVVYEVLAIAGAVSGLDSCGWTSLCLSPPCILIDPPPVDPIIPSPIIPPGGGVVPPPGCSIPPVASV